MGVLEEYLEQLQDTFDVSTLFDPDVEKIESVNFNAPLIYKYFREKGGSSL
jgi:hypothetical protein